MTGRTPARLLAPIALVTTALALFLILSGGGDETSSGEREADVPAETAPAPEGGGNGGEESGDDDEGGSGGGGGSDRPRRYTVEAGDTPSGIAEEHGMSVEELLDLNPEVDPQALSPGQRLRLR